MYDDEISIVLAVYNGEKYLKKLIDSILKQIDVNINEIIIVDDCSNDGSKKIIDSYADEYKFIKFFTNEFNLGPIQSFIKGAKVATAKYVAFADQDDIWLDNKLKISIDLIKNTDGLNKPAVVFTDLKLIDENGQTVHDSFWQLYNIDPNKNNFFTLLFGNIATGCTMVINRLMLNEFIDMPEGALMHDHWIALIGFSFGTWRYSESKTVLYRVHENSVTTKNKSSFFKIATNFLKASFKKNPDFLDGKINQAFLFKSKYESILEQHHINQLNYFINLKNSSGILKKINSKYRFVISKRIL